MRNHIKSFMGRKLSRPHNSSSRSYSAARGRDIKRGWAKGYHLAGQKAYYKRKRYFKR